MELFLLFLSALTAGGVSAADPPLLHLSVEVNHDIMLPCSAGSTDLILETFDWKRNNVQDVFFYERGSHYNNGKEGQDEHFKGRVEHFSDQLEHGNASIKIKQTSVSDSGIYTCERIINGRPVLLSTIHLTVGACSKPRIKQLNVTSDKVHLLCSVLGVYPKPEVELKDSSNNSVQSKDIPQSKTGENYNIIIYAVVKKTDEYHCVAKQLDICHEIFSDPLTVHSPIKVKEDDEVVLSCSVGDIDMTKKSFDWKKDGQDVYFYEHGKDPKKVNDRASHFPNLLKFGNVSIRIKHVKVNDSGTYTCIFPNQKPEIRATIQLKVECILKDRSQENIPGRCLMPTLKTRESKNSVLVECKVVGALSEPEIELQNKNNRVIPANQPTYLENNGTFILTAEVTEKGHYSCVVRQTDICHEVRSELYFLPDPGFSIGTLLIGMGIGAVVVILVLVIVYLITKKKPKESAAPKDTGTVEEQLEIVEKEMK